MVSVREAVKIRKQIRSDLASKNPARQKAAQAASKKYGVFPTSSNTGKLVKVSAGKGSSGSSSYYFEPKGTGLVSVTPESGKAVEDEVQRQKAVGIRAEQVFARAASEGREPTQFEIRSIRGGMAGEKDFREYMKNRLILKQEILKAQKKQENQRQSSRFGFDVKVDKEDVENWDRREVDDGDEYNRHGFSSH